jgi:hypothetical protein
MANSNSDDKILVWGDEPVIYALSKRLPLGKYTAKYHILDFGASNETLYLLNHEPPRYVVTFNNQDQLPGLSEQIKKRFILEKTIGDANVYRRLGYN